jgi:hypothetical protein
MVSAAMQDDIKLSIVVGLHELQYYQLYYYVCSVLYIGFFIY